MENALPNAAAAPSSPGLVWRLRSTAAELEYVISKANIVWQISMQRLTICNVACIMGGSFENCVAQNSSGRPAYVFAPLRPAHGSPAEDECGADSADVELPCSSSSPSLSLSDNDRESVCAALPWDALPCTGCGSAGRTSRQCRSTRRRSDSMLTTRSNTGCSSESRNSMRRTTTREALKGEEACDSGSAAADRDRTNEAMSRSSAAEGGFCISSTSVSAISRPI
jgi:hypothetical protein